MCEAVEAEEGGGLEGARVEEEDAGGLEGEVGVGPWAPFLDPTIQLSCSLMNAIV